MRVLLADDSQTNRLILRLLLAKLGIETRCVPSGLQALALLRTERFDLLLLDIHMPGLDGHETARRVRGQLGLSELPIVAMTADEVENGWGAGRDAAIDGVLVKPVMREQLLAVLRRARQGTLPATAFTPPR